MIEWLKKWGGVAGSVVTILALFGAAGAYADKMIDERVEIKLAGALKSELQTMTRRLNGVQEQVNTGASNSRVIQQKLQHIESQQVERDKSIERQLNLIIKLIEQKE